MLIINKSIKYKLIYYLFCKHEITQQLYSEKNENSRSFSNLTNFTIIVIITLKFFIIFLFLYTFNSTLC